jgi:hypothetical protein
MACDSQQSMSASSNGGDDELSFMGFPWRFKTS